MILRFLCLFSCFCSIVFGESSLIVNGNVRVSALSPTLLRIEPKGPKGFEDKPTFNIVSRTIEKTPPVLKKLNESAEGTWLSTPFYSVFVPSHADGGCAQAPM